MRLLLLTLLCTLAMAQETLIWRDIPRTVYEIEAPGEWKPETKTDRLTLEVRDQKKIIFTVESKVEPNADLETVAKVHLTRWNARSDKYTLTKLDGVKAGKLRGYRVTVEVREANSSPREAVSYVFPALLAGDYLWIWNEQGVEVDRVDKMVRTLRMRR